MQDKGCAGLPCHISCAAPAINVPLARGQRWACPHHWAAVKWIRQACWGMHQDNHRKVKLKLVHVLHGALRAEEALLCSTETRWTLWLFFGFLRENSVHMAWNQHLICQFKSHHYTLLPTSNFCCCFTNRTSPGSRYVLRQFSEICQLFILFAEPLLESKSPISFLLFPAGYMQLLFWKERLCIIVILLSNL